MSNLDNLNHIETTETTDSFSAVEQDLTNEDKEMLEKRYRGTGIKPKDFWGLKVLTGDDFETTIDRHGRQEDPNTKEWTGGTIEKSDLDAINKAIDEAREKKDEEKEEFIGLLRTSLSEEGTQLHNILSNRDVVVGELPSANFQAREGEDYSSLERQEEGKDDVSEGEEIDKSTEEKETKEYDNLGSKIDTGLDDQTAELFEKSGISMEKVFASSKDLLRHSMAEHVRPLLKKQIQENSDRLFGRGEDTAKSVEGYTSILQQEVLESVTDHRLDNMTFAFLSQVTTGLQQGLQPQEGEGYKQNILRRGKFFSALKGLQEKDNMTSVISLMLERSNNNINDIGAVQKVFGNFLEDTVDMEALTDDIRGINKEKKRDELQENVGATADKAMRAFDDYNVTERMIGNLLGGKDVEKMPSDLKIKETEPTGADFQKMQTALKKMTEGLPTDPAIQEKLQQKVMNDTIDTYVDNPLVMMLYEWLKDTWIGDLIRKYAEQQFGIDDLDGHIAYRQDIKALTTGYEKKSSSEKDSLALESDKLKPREIQKETLSSGHFMIGEQSYKYDTSRDGYYAYEMSTGADGIRSEIFLEDAEKLDMATIAENIHVDNFFSTFTDHITKKKRALPAIDKLVDGGLEEDAAKKQFMYDNLPDVLKEDMVFDTGDVVQGLYERAMQAWNELPNADKGLPVKKENLEEPKEKNATETTVEAGGESGGTDVIDDTADGFKNAESAPGAESEEGDAEDTNNPPEGN